MQLIPAIDLRDGRCVRLFQGRFDAETVYSTEPSTVLEQYFALGASLVHVVDLDGAREGSQGNARAIADLAGARRAALQVGGGVRTRDTVRRLLDAGVSRAVVGSTAVSQPGEVAGWLREFGPEAIVIAFDIRLDDMAVPRLTTHGWERQTATSLWDAVERFLPHGLRHVLCTDVARDGAMTGPNVDLYREAARRFPAIAWQASGGVRDVGDLRTLAAAGAAAAISGRALLEGRMQREELEPFLRNA
jgi:phosphoribosylformimino-5-aminoimidazole carboxamide ribotide isomerase